jgi:hypothetical protein
MTEQLLAVLRSLRAFVQMATAECVRANERAADTAVEVAKLHRDLDRIRIQLGQFHVKPAQTDIYEWPMPGQGGSR